jgi:hypothetical protein
VHFQVEFLEEVLARQKAKKDICGKEKSLQTKLPTTFAT